MMETHLLPNARSDIIPLAEFTFGDIKSALMLKLDEA